jgi:plasmid stabilization system protein ParE
LKVTYTEEAVADIVDAITYLNERNPTAAANLDAEIAQCIERPRARIPRSRPLPLRCQHRQRFETIDSAIHLNSPSVSAPGFMRDSTDSV